MPPDDFDLKKVHRNWSLAVDPAGPPRPAGRVPPAKAPVDPFVVARADLARIRALVSSQLAREAATIAPFVARIERAIDDLETAASPPSGEGERASPADLRDELDDALYDLEDLLEAFSLTRR